MIAVEAEYSARLGPARYQGLRPTCMAFAVSDLNALVNSTDHLSVDFLCHHAANLAHDWQPADGFSADDVLTAASGPGQPSEADYPYDETSADRPRKVPPEGLGPLFTAVPHARDLDVDEVIQRVRAGQAVGLVLAVTESFYYPAAGIVNFEHEVIPDLYHALIGVGVGTHVASGELHMLLRNSWGAAWGTVGHAWVSEQHLKLHFNEGFIF